MQKACNNFRNREINTEEEGFLRIRDTIILFSISNFTRLFLLPPDSWKNLETESRRNFNTNSIAAIKLIPR